jgi:hypothetical protein
MFAEVCSAAVSSVHIGAQEADFCAVKYHFELDVMFLSICELLENRFREGRTIVTGVSEVTFARAVHRETAWHFDSKERLADVGAHRLQEVSVSRLVFSRPCGHHGDNPAVGAYPHCVLSHRR